MSQRNGLSLGIALVVSLALTGVWGVAAAVTNPFTFVQVHATRVENDLPSTLYFQVDAVAGSCAAGVWLQYVPPAGTAADQLENLKGAYALLLAAVSSGARIAIYGWDGVTPGNLCVVNSVSVLAN